MESTNKFNPGDSVIYRDGMDFQNFTGVVESSINNKGFWEYLVKDVKRNAVKRVAEKYLEFSEPILKLAGGKNKFNAGDAVVYRNEVDAQHFKGIVERPINNYKGLWEYLVKDGNDNVVKRVAEKYLELNKQPASTK